MGRASSLLRVTNFSESKLDFCFQPTDSKEMLLNKQDCLKTYTQEKAIATQTFVRPPFLLSPPEK